MPTLTKSRPDRALNLANNYAENKNIALLRFVNSPTKQPSIRPLLSRTSFAAEHIRVAPCQPARPSLTKSIHLTIVCIPDGFSWLLSCRMRHPLPLQWLMHDEHSIQAGRTLAGLIRSQAPRPPRESAMNFLDTLSSVFGKTTPEDDHPQTFVATALELVNNQPNGLNGFPADAN